MCGIAGFLASPAMAAEKARGFADVAAALHHRGPDSWGEHRVDGFGCVHTRLSIVDLSPAGHQPYVDAHHVLVFNGEIYNHAELRARLPHRGAECRGSSDTATLFALLAHFGVDATLPLLKGMFAFAWYDVRTATLWACRDRFGIKPLVWSRQGGAVYFASEKRALQPWMPLHVDPVQALFALSGLPDRSWARTAFRGVEQVPPGHLLHCREGGEPELRAWFRVVDLVDRARHEELARMPRREVVREFGRLFEASTRSMLMGDARMGAFVSGGIDSGLAATVASRGIESFDLFTADVVGPQSELAGAQQLATLIGRPLVPARFEPAQLLDDWATATLHYELPIISHINAVPFAAVARAARAHGVKAILSGEGSDELFLGYPRLLTKRYDWLIRAPLEAVRRLYAVSPRLRAYVLDGETREAFIARLVNGFEDELRRVEGREAFSWLAPAERDAQFLTLDMFGSHLLTLLHRNDRMGMSASIEARFPFLDEALVAFGVNLPVRHKTAWTRRFVNVKHPFLEDKSVVREYARGLLPATRANQRKVGFPVLGLQSLAIEPGFFTGGFVDEVLGLGHRRERHLLGTQTRYFVGKLASLEVFGRLFAMGWTPDQVTAHVRAHVRVTMPD